MNHEELKEALFTFHDGELAGKERQEVETHLVTCSDCRLALERWKKISGVLLRPAKIAPSEEFVSRVMRRIEEERPAVLGLRDALEGLWDRVSLPNLAWAGSAAVLLVFASLYFYSRPSRFLVASADEGLGLQYAEVLMENALDEKNVEKNEIETDIEEHFL
ncbi:MAG: zf-HC2 domain-containing protein [Elusimicrobiota bacterium]